MSIQKLIVSRIYDTSGMNVPQSSVRAINNLTLEQLDILAKNLFKDAYEQALICRTFTTEVLECLIDINYTNELEAYIHYRNKMPLESICRVITTKELDNTIIHHISNLRKDIIEDVVDACVGSKQDLLAHPLFNLEEDDEDERNKELTFLKLASYGVVVNDYAELEFYNNFPYNQLITAYKLKEIGLTEEDLLLMKETPLSLDFFYDMAKLLKVVAKPHFDALKQLRFGRYNQTIFEITHFEVDFLLLMLQHSKENPEISFYSYYDKYNLHTLPCEYKTMMPRYFYERLNTTPQEVDIEMQSGQSSFVLMANLLESYLEEATISHLKYLLGDKIVPLSLLKNIFKLATSSQKEEFEVMLGLITDYEGIESLDMDENVGQLDTPREYTIFEDYLFHVFKKEAEKRLN